MKIIVVSVIGLVAAGKSTLAKRIIGLSKVGALLASVIVINFDDHLDVDFDNLSNGKYKRLREDLLQKIEGAIKQLLQSERYHWDEILTDELKIRTDNFHFKVNGLDLEPTLILLDDNNYFHSMRQRNRALSRNIQCHHFQIYIKSSLHEAKLRNQKRSRPVPESIIDRMFHQLETPTNSNTIIITPGVEDEDLIHLLHDRIENPEKVIEVERIQQQQSILHEMDIITRKELSIKIQSLKSSSNISSYCATLNQKRKEFLQNFKSKMDLEDDIETLRRSFLCYLNQQTVNFTQ